MIGTVYLERGQPVTVIVGWKGRGPRNVLIQRADGSEVVRPFRGLRRAYRQCKYCHRERHACDVFWHRDDKAWYCADVFACEHRAAVWSGDTA